MSREPPYVDTWIAEVLEAYSAKEEPDPKKYAVQLIWCVRWLVERVKAARAERDKLLIIQGKAGTWLLFSDICSKDLKEEYPGAMLAKYVKAREELRAALEAK